MNLAVTPYNPQIAENIDRLHGARLRLRNIEIELEGVLANSGTGMLPQRRADEMRVSIAAIQSMINAADADLQDVNASFLGVPGGRK